MKKLTIEHLAPYLPYGLRGYFLKEIDIILDIELENGLIGGLNLGTIELKNFKPILRPLSDLEMYGDFEQSQADYIIDKETESQLSICEWNELFGNHFDVFGLIEQGLAIDINTIN